jgi:predicted deacetylase
MQKIERFFVLDLTRGLAVLLMIAAHAVYFLTNRDNSVLLGFEQLGNTFCFVAFLFISGAVSYVAYFKDPELGSGNFKRIAKRLLLYLIGYFILAFFVASKDFIAAGLAGKVKIVFDLLSLRNLPSYTEYLPIFILMPLLATVFYDKVQILVKKFPLLLTVSVASYLLGYLLYLLPMPSFILPWKALLSGAEGFYRFPVLQYLPVYLFGLYFGSRLLHLEGNKKKTTFSLFLAATLGLLLIGSILLERQGLNLFDRWPPAPGFLFVGLFFSLLFVYLSYLTKRWHFVPIFRDFLLVLGQNAFAFFWSHIFLLSLWQLAGGSKTSSLFVYLIAVIFLFILSLALSTFLPFNFSFVLTLIRSSKEQQEELIEKQSSFVLGKEIVGSIYKEEKALKRFFWPSDDGTLRRRRLIKKRHLLLGALIGVAAAIFLFPIALKEAKTLLRANQPAAWWSEDFAYRQNFIVKNLKTLSDISEGQSLKFSFDHQALVKAGRSLPDGGDLALIYQGDNQAKLVESITISGQNTANAEVVFRSPIKIAGGKTDYNFFLYFGNNTPSLPRLAFDRVEPPTEYEIRFEKLEPFPFLAKTGRRWHLLDLQNSPINFYLETDRSYDDNPVVTYNILETDDYGQMDRSSDRVFSASIPVKSLAPGSYTLQIDFQVGDVVYQSQKHRFFVSHPLYAAWSLDWEGYDISNAYLEALLRISESYKLPMTHFVSARTWSTNTISDERKVFLARWLNTRLKKGDSLGLHVHMFYDLVDQAAVSKRLEPNWGDNGDGYGVPTSAYTAEEQAKIIDKSLEILGNAGLPRPYIFRAGGWFASLETLAALEKTGFLADSSGRTPFKFGKNQLPVAWNLTAETQPYLPSREDQNMPSNSNAFGVLEIPNNGADSYWFSGEEMIRRFYANYQKKPLPEKKSVVFLSHPHWFKESEQQKIEQLLQETGKYLFDSDLGPVLYANQDEILEAWSK